MKPKFKQIDVTTKRVNVGTVNVRSSADASSNENIIFTLPLGTIVTVLSTESKKWTKIQKDDTVGYIMSQYLT